MRTGGEGKEDTRVRKTKLTALSEKIGGHDGGRKSEEEEEGGGENDGKLI